jgi:hypothetical protein
MKDPQKSIAVHLKPARVSFHWGLFDATNAKTTRRWFLCFLVERVRLTEAPFAGIEGVYQMADGERRVMVLIEILSKPVAVRVAPASLRKAS